MANFQFTTDLIADVAFRLGEPADNVSSELRPAILAHLNRAYRALWMGGGELDPAINERWLWLKKDPPGVLILDPLIDAGTVSVTNNNATITLSSAPAASVAGRFFQVDGRSDVFRISAHTGGSGTATLDSVYTGETGSGLSYRLMKLEYSLAADVLHIISPMRVDGQWDFEVDGIELSVLDRDYPLPLTRGGAPDKFAHVTMSKVRFNAYGGDESTELSRVEYDYLQKPADLTDSSSEEPLVPLQYRQVLADYALGMMLAVNNDARSAGFLGAAKSGLQAMKIDNQQHLRQISKSLGCIYPRGNKAAHRRIKLTGNDIPVWVR